MFVHYIIVVIYLSRATVILIYATCNSGLKSGSILTVYYRAVLPQTALIRDLTAFC